MNVSKKRLCGTVEAGALGGRGGSSVFLGLPALPGAVAMEGLPERAGALCRGEQAQSIQVVSGREAETAQLRDQGSQDTALGIRGLPGEGRHLSPARRTRNL